MGIALKDYIPIVSERTRELLGMALPPFARYFFRKDESAEYIWRGILPARARVLSGRLTDSAVSWCVYVACVSALLSVETSPEWNGLLPAKAPTL